MKAARLRLPWRDHRASRRSALGAADRLLYCSHPGLVVEKDLLVTPSAHTVTPAEFLRATWRSQWSQEPPTVPETQGDRSLSERTDGSEAECIHDLMRDECSELALIRV